MLDLKTINSVLDQLEEEKGIPREKVLEAVEMALASAYKKEYGKKGQIIRANFDLNSGKTEFFQIKIVVDESMIKPENEENEDETNKTETKKTSPKKTAISDNISQTEQGDEEKKIRFNPEQHMMLEDAKKIKKDVEVNDEIIFPLEPKEDFGRIAAQTAKQTIIQKIREAEKTSVFKEFGGKQGDIISGTIQRIERGNIFVDLGRATGIMPYEEQIRGERYKQGERIRAYLYSVEETPKGVFLKLSRTHPQFLQKLFEIEAPEIASGIVEIKGIVREAGSRSKIAAHSTDEHIDPIGSLVGQRGVRVSTIMSELGGEKIDIIEWSEDPEKFIGDALSPAKIMGMKLNEEEKTAKVEVSEDQQSLAIGKGGQNVRLAAKLTGWKIDIKGIGGVDLEGKKKEEKETKPEETEKEEESNEKTTENNSSDTITDDNEEKTKENIENDEIKKITEEPSKETTPNTVTDDKEKVRENKEEIKEEEKETSVEVEEKREKTPSKEESEETEEEPFAEKEEGVKEI